MHIAGPDSDFLEEFLKESPVFYAFIRAIECRFVHRTPFEPPVLDLGCGDGLFGTILFKNQPGAISFGVDLSTKDIQKAKQTNTYRALQVADMSNLPFADNSIGSILSNSVFEHLESIEAALHEAWRILKPGGKLVLTAPNDRVADNFLVSRLFRALGLAGTARAIGNFGNKVLGNRICLSPQQWEEKLRGAGFESVECSTIVPPGIFNISEIFIPLGLFSILSKRISGRLLLTQRRLTLKPLHALLKKYYEYDGDSPGLACVVVAVK